MESRETGSGMNLIVPSHGYRRQMQAITVLRYFFLLVFIALTGCAGMASHEQRYASKISDSADFYSLSRSIDKSTVSPLPHVMFLIDRRDSNRMYYINCHLYDWHLTFARAEYLSYDGLHDFVEHNYHSPERRFVLGNVVWQPALGRYTWELYEDDTPTPEIVRFTDSLVNATFYAPVIFTPISIFQEALADKLTGLAIIQHSVIAGHKGYTALHTGSGVGRLHIVRDTNDDIRREDILVLTEMPLDLAPVSGVIAAQPSTVLSHVNLLARSWNIPNIYLKDANEKLRSLDGKWVALRADLDTFNLREATKDEIEDVQDALRNHRHIVAESNLRERRLLPLSEQRARMRVAFGAKSANLGEIVHGEIKNVHVPPGFGIPFVYYKEFVASNGFDTVITKLIADSSFQHNRRIRRERLVALRSAMESGTFDTTLAREIFALVHKSFAGKGLFIRSSTNNEDLADFSGAGLYSTVPNVRGDSALLQAIKTVWASVWNVGAYDARESAGIDHASVYMGILVQEAIPSESSGVMITANPFDRDDVGAVYISAKRGLGMKVVDGGRVAEQVLFRPGYNSMRVITHSEENEMLVFDSAGGIKPIPTPPQTKVLTEELTLELARVAKELKHLFDYRNQDIEWAFSKGTLFIVQSRPYIDPH